MNTMEELSKEYSMWMTKANALETQHKEALQNAESLQRVINLMKHPLNLPINEQVVTSTLQPMGKYKSMTMNAAIFDILKTETNLTTSDIYQRLIDNGFQSNSKTLKRDVATKLSGLKKHGNIESTIENGISRFSLLSAIPTRRRKKL